MFIHTFNSLCVCFCICVHMCAPLQTSSSVCDSVTNLHYRAHLLTCRGAKEITIDIAMVTVALLFPATHNTENVCVCVFVCVCVCVCEGGVLLLVGVGCSFPEV